MNLKQLIYRLGSAPKLSLNRFLTGLALFAISAAFIISGYLYHHLLQIPGLIILPFALFFAIYGYLGLFANRFAQVISINDPDNIDANKSGRD
ncbi:hypothetical protein ORJ66_09370 [Pseudoalteromonas tunicata]|uniref:hypothetical protein n=1 Tax=Pseudoalteromonas tunicata TaxID=314281 RepID=UPI00273FEE9F|nr:hypothetical protein [Pseudoalteromonas tunicata]MDP5213248.1 hypothetical protein [Pseudoalteromonas tunicata]